MNDPERFESGKVTTLFVLMAVSDESNLRGQALMERVTGLQSQCIAALLNDETGEVRENLRTRFENLAAHYAEFDTRSHPWEI